MRIWDFVEYSFLVKSSSFNRVVRFFVFVGSRDGKIRVWVWPFWFRTRMTIYLPGSGYKPELFNYGSGLGSTQKNSDFRIAGSKPGSWMKACKLNACHFCLFGIAEAENNRSNSWGFN